MKTTRLNELLSSLSNKEFVSLNDFLNSPYLNKNKQVTLFYFFLSAKQTHPDHSSVQREEIFEYIYKGQKFDPAKFLKVSSDFSKAVEQFLILELTQQKDLRNKRTLLEIAGSRDLHKTFSKYLNEINVTLENEFNKDLDFYLAEYESRVEAMLYEMNNKRFDLERSLLGINDTVDVMIAHSKLEMMIKLFHTSGKKNKIFFAKEVEEFLGEKEDHLKKYHPMIYLRGLILKMFNDSDNDIYTQIRSFIHKNEKRISRENLAYLYDKLMTFCNMNTGDSYRSEEFELIRSLENNSMIYEEGTEPDPVHLLKVIDAALNENDAYWAEKFLKKYETGLNETFRESTVNLASASICIYRKKFTDALTHISKVSSHNDFFYLGSKVMSLIIFYELGDTQSVNYTLESFRVYLMRNKNGKEIDYAPYKNFLALFKLLAGSYNRRQKSDKKFLINKIKNEQNLINREWLLRKAESI